MGRSTQPRRASSRQSAVHKQHTVQHALFPGFSVDSIHATLPNHLKAASVVARAFPERADVLRKRLRLAEDSERFLFATRLAGSLDHVYIVATRLA